MLVIVLAEMKEAIQLLSSEPKLNVFLYLKNIPGTARASFIMECGTSYPFHEKARAVSFSVRKSVRQDGREGDDIQ